MSDVQTSEYAQGWDACRRGLPPSNCPHPINSAERARWRLGYQANMSGGIEPSERIQIQRHPAPAYQVNGVSAAELAPEATARRKKDDAIIVPADPSRVFLAGFPPTPHVRDPRPAAKPRPLFEIEETPGTADPLPAFVDGYSPIILAEDDTHPEPEPVALLDARYDPLRVDARVEDVRKRIASGAFTGPGVPGKIKCVQAQAPRNRKDTRNRRTTPPPAPVPEAYPEPAHVGSRIHPHSPEVKAAKNRLHVRNHWLRSHGHPEMDAYVSADGRIILRATGLEVPKGAIIVNKPSK